jgi:hypothetical protein
MIIVKKDDVTVYPVPYTLMESQKGCRENTYRCSVKRCRPPSSEEEVACTAYWLVIRFLADNFRE